jgi:hypothetical protein
MVDDMSAKFSPGPWRTDEAGDVYDANGDRVCTAIAENDNLLIVAAPEMFELLDTLAEYEHRWSCSDEWCRDLIPKLYALRARIEGKEDPDAPG